MDNRAHVGAIMFHGIDGNTPAEANEVKGTVWLNIGLTGNGNKITFFPQSAGPPSEQWRDLEDFLEKCLDAVQAARVKQEAAPEVERIVNMVKLAGECLGFPPREVKP